MTKLTKDHNTFMVKATMATIVNYNCNMFIVQVTCLIFGGSAMSEARYGSSGSRLNY
jgi:hypothetical protein